MWASKDQESGGKEGGSCSARKRMWGEGVLAEETMPLYSWMDSTALDTIGMGNRDPPSSARLDPNRHFENIAIILCRKAGKPHCTALGVQVSTGIPDPSMSVQCLSVGGVHSDREPLVQGAGDQGNALTLG